jgi:rare lipoprotein A
LDIFVKYYFNTSREESIQTADLDQAGEVKVSFDPLVTLMIAAANEYKPNERKQHLRNQNKRRSIKATVLTAALAGVVATGAGVAPSLAKTTSHHSDGSSDAGIRHHGGGARLTYFYRGGKLHLVNTDTNGGLEGVASVYHDPITANGEHMDPSAMTAAHKSLPMGSRVTVHNRSNGRSVTVRINDRGPYVTGRVIDLSPGAARVIGMDGLAPVSLTVNG